MNYEEEQEMEIEALTSIFEEGKEFVRISPTDFKLKLLPNPAGDEENHVAVTLHITYTPEYPESAPLWELEDVKLPDQKVEELKEKVEETINSSLGMAMIYTVAEACQDYLKENNTKALSMHEEMMQRLGPAEGEEEEDDDDDEDGSGEEPEEEWKGLADKAMVPESDRITIESFGTWKIKFDAEMLAAGILKREEFKAKSGKQIFIEAGADGKDSSPNAEGGASGKSGEDGALVYNAALFGEVDDDDLDGLSGED